MRCHDDASTDVVMAIRYIFVSEVQKYRGNVREEDNNDQVMYKNKKKMISLKKGFSLFLKNLMIKEVFYAFTTNTVLFTTYKRLGLCTKQNKNKSVSSTMVSNLIPIQLDCCLSHSIGLLS